MTNEERIYKLCEYIMDLIDEIQNKDKDINLDLEWIRDEITSIREDIHDV